MKNNNTNDLKSILIYIKNRFGVEVFGKEGRIVALLSDLAPNLKNDRIMVERMSRTGILERFAKINKYDINAQKREVARAMDILVQDEYIVSEIAENYVKILVEVFEWEKLLETLKANSNKKIQLSSEQHIQGENNKEEVISAHYNKFFTSKDETSVLIPDTDLKKESMQRKWGIGLVVGFILLLSIGIYSNDVSEREPITQINSESQIVQDMNKSKEIDEQIVNNNTNVLESDNYIHLSKLTAVGASSDEGTFKYYDTVKDNFGTTYSNGIGGSDGYGQSWQEYQLNGTYCELRGRIVLNYDVRTKESDQVYLWIYGDDIVIYQSPVITAGISPIDFTIDISNVTTLKVVIQGESMLRLVDCYLYTDSSIETVSSAMKVEENKSSQVYLSKLNWFNASSSKGGFNYYDAVKDNFETTYSNGIGGTDGYGQSWQEYHLNKEYSELRGRVVLNYDARTKTNEGAFLWIYGDDNLLYQSEEIKAGHEPSDFKIDISDVTTLKVVIQGEAMIRLVDCCLYTDSSIETVSSATEAKENNAPQVYLSNLNWFNASSSKGGFKYYDAVKDNFETTYSNGIGGTDGYGQSWQEYRLNEGYSEMRGKVVLNYDARTQTNEGVYLWIYGDGNLLYQSDEIKAGHEPSDFRIDISNVTTLKVVIQGEAMLRLVDCCLYTDSSIETVSSAMKVAENKASKVYLSNLNWFNASSSKGGFNYYDAVKDNFETTYSNGIGGIDSYGQSWQEYRLNEGYGEMRGKVVLNYDARTQTNEGVYLWIYGDGNLLYQSDEIKAGYEPSDFRIDISDVTTLKVVIQGEAMLRLVDCALYK